MDLMTVTKEALNTRQRLLEQEIEASEEEARQLQVELNKVYAEQDRRRCLIEG